MSGIGISSRCPASHAIRTDAAALTLHAFCTPKLQCSDRSNPVGQVTLYGGSIFGVTHNGGVQGTNGGVVYQYTP